MVCQANLLVFIDFSIATTRLLSPRANADYIAKSGVNRAAQHEWASHLSPVAGEPECRRLLTEMELID
jgi:hypothetical protein